MKARRRVARVTYRNRVADEKVIKRTGLVDLDKLQVRSRLRWNGHVYPRENDHALKSKDQVFQPGMRPAGRPQRCWIVCGT